MAEEIPEVARKIADQMLQKYGRNDIYHKIVEQITDRAEITLRQIKDLNP
jgi:hypothetical protein